MSLGAPAVFAGAFDVIGFVVVPFCSGFTSADFASACAFANLKAAVRVRIGPFLGCDAAESPLVLACIGLDGAGLGAGLDGNVFCEAVAAVALGLTGAVLAADTVEGLTAATLGAGLVAVTDGLDGAALAETALAAADVVVAFEAVILELIVLVTLLGAATVVDVTLDVAVLVVVVVVEVARGFPAKGFVGAVVLVVVVLDATELTAGLVVDGFIPADLEDKVDAGFVVPTVLVVGLVVCLVVGLFVESATGGFVIFADVIVTDLTSDLASGLTPDSSFSDLTIGSVTGAVVTKSL